MSFRNTFHLPLIFEAHEIFFLTTERRERERKIRSQEARLYSHLDGVVAITQGLADQLHEIFQLSAPWEVIPDGVNLQFFGKDPTHTKTKKILYVGQLYPWKGVGTLIEAMRFLAEGELHLVGGSEEQINKLKEKVLQMGRNDRVIFHGQVSPHRVKEHLAEAAVGVLPLTQNVISASFTSPLKLFEYMAAGIPIVSSDLPSIREILKDGDNALLVQPDNPLKLAQGIQKIFGDPQMADRLAQKAYADVSLYTWTRRAEKIVQFLRSLSGIRH